MRVPYAYLDKQFADPAPFLEDIERLVRTGDFTLGYLVRELEDRFAHLTGLPYAIGVSSGTDALMLSLQVQGVGFGAIAMTGATPVFVDNTDDYTIDVEQIGGSYARRGAAAVAASA